MAERGFSDATPVAVVVVAVLNEICSLRSMPDHHDLITDVIRRAPEWLRRDLLSDDHVARAAAEEALSAKIAAALSDATET